MYNGPKNPETNDTPDPRPVYEGEDDKLYDDPARRPRLPNTEGENIDDDDFDGNPPPRPTHNP